MDDPYGVLGVSPGASKDEVKRAYRALAKKYHPDSHPGDKVAEQKMKEINAAYDQIMNPERYRRRPTTAGAHSSSTPSGAGTAGGGYTGNPYGNGDPFAGWYTGPRGSGSGTGNPGGGTDEDPFGGWGTFWFPFGFGTWGTWDASGQRGSSTQEPAVLRAARGYIERRDFSEALHVLDSVGIHDRTARWYYYHARANQGAGKRALAEEDARRSVEMEPGNMEYRMFYAQVQSQPGNTTYSETGQPYRSSGSFLRSILISLILTILLTLACNPLLWARF